MKRSLFLLLLLFAVATVFAQTYDAVMPGQKKVTTVDSTGNATTQIVTDYDSEYIQYRSGGSWFYKGQTMSKDEFVSKMKSECTPAYEQFQRGERQNVPVLPWLQPEVRYSLPVCPFGLGERLSQMKTLQDVSFGIHRCMPDLVFGWPVWL